MASLDSLKMRYYLKRGAIGVAWDETPIMFRLSYTGSGTATSVVATSGTSLVLTDSVGGALTYLTATYTTVGAMADAINASGYWMCKVLDALRSDSVNGAALFYENTSVTAGTDDYGNTVYDIHTSTAVSKSLTYTLSLKRNINTGLIAVEGHRVHLQEIVYNVAALGGAGANLVRVYFRTKNSAGHIETQQAGYLSVSGTKTTINWASGVGYLTAPEGSEIICRIQDGTSLAANAANFFQVTGIYE